MQTVNITNARKDIYNLVESVNVNHEPVLITGKDKNAVLLGEDDWNVVKEQIRLCPDKQYADSLLQGVNMPIEECIPEEKVKW